MNSITPTPIPAAATVDRPVTGWREDEEVDDVGSGELGAVAVAEVVPANMGMVSTI